MEAARRIVANLNRDGRFMFGALTPATDADMVARALIRMQESNRILADALERLLYAVNGINQGGMAITPEEMAETNRDCQEVHKAWSAARIRSLKSPPGVRRGE
jgi:hypothetical protein